MRFASGTPVLHRITIFHVMALVTLLTLTMTAAGQVSVPAETTNAALRYWMAFALMQDPPADPAIGDLLEEIASGEAAWDEIRLGAIMDANRDAIAILQRASTLPSADWGVEYSLGPYAAIPHLAKARVLARLNTVAGRRALAQEEIDEAFEIWLGGLRFSRHIASDSSLTGVLSARAAFIANSLALREAAPRLTGQQRARVVATVEAWPEEVFDWGQALGFEAAALVSGAQMAETSPELLSEISGNDEENSDLEPPTEDEVAEFTRVAGRIVEAFREGSDLTDDRLAQLEDSQASLHPFLQLLPDLDRVNSSRAELRQERERLLEAMAR